MDHNVLITGASRGIGFALARQYLARGSRVVATARNTGGDDLLALQQQYRDQIELLTLDVTSAKAIAVMQATLTKQPLHLLINNAGLYTSGDDSMDTLDSDIWLNEIRVNTIAPFMVTRALRPNLAATDHATVAMISSKMGSLAENRSGGAYSYRSSKAALNAVMRSLAHDLACNSISVVALHPGWVRTDMGGPKAPVDTTASAIGLKSVLDKVGPDDSGKFFDYTGVQIPW
jgi:NAD(P)-dependent dehydrogenase (short-subunit alcohol dehydrogenase family)